LETEKNIVLGEVMLTRQLALLEVMRRWGQRTGAAEQQLFSMRETLKRFNERRQAILDNAARGNDR
jgi:hypothetical protein